VRQIACSTLDRAASSLEVDPEEVSQERFLEVAVDVWMVDDPQQLVDRQYRLTHRLDEPVFSLYNSIFYLKPMKHVVQIGAAFALLEFRGEIRVPCGLVFRNKLLI